MSNDGADDAALFHACPTFQAAFLVDDVAFFRSTCDAMHRTFLDAKGTSNALIRNFIFEQALTDASGTGFVDDMGQIFFPEIL